MLTDYHLHLRPDELSETADRYFTPANAQQVSTTIAVVAPAPSK